MLTDDDIVIELARRVAPELEVFCAARQLTYANELHHLTPVCKAVIAQLAAEVDPPPSLSPFAFGDKVGWKVGNVDVVFRWSDRKPIFVELKCDTDLSACVWDALKLASGVLNGNAASGYLLAGASGIAWSKPAHGSEMFRDGRWQTTGPRIRGAYAKQFRKWEQDGYRPGRVPEEFETVALGAFPLEIGDAQWELRVARVEPVGVSWTVWRSVLPGTATVPGGDLGSGRLAPAALPRVRPTGALG